MLFFTFFGWEIEDEKAISIVRKQMMLYMATIAIFVAVVLRRIDNILYQTLYGRETGGIDSAGRKKSHRPTRRDTGQAI